MSSFQGVGIEEYRDVFISGGWNRGVPLYTEVSLFQGVGIVYTEVFSFQDEEFHCIQRCSHFSYFIKRYPYFRRLE